MKKPLSAMQRTMFTTFGICMAGCIMAATLYLMTGAAWLELLAITCGTTAYHLLIRFLSPLALKMIHPAAFDCHAWWFRQRRWEPALYSRLRVQQWKTGIPTWNPEEFSLEKPSLEQIAQNMCHAEAVHELIMLLSFTSLLFIIPFGAPAVFLITAILAAMFDGVFVILQRYNRPRIVMILDRRRTRAQTDTPSNQAPDKSGVSS